MSPAILTPRGFRPVIQPRRGRVLPFRRIRGMGDTPQTFQQALAAAGWKPGQPIPQIDTPPGGWPDINPYTGAVIAPAIVTTTAGGPAGDQLVKGASVTIPPPATTQPAPAQPVQPAGAPSPSALPGPQSTNVGILTYLTGGTFFGIPIWMLATAAIVGFLIFNQDKGHYGR